MKKNTFFVILLIVLAVLVIGISITILVINSKPDNKEVEIGTLEVEETEETEIATDEYIPDVADGIIESDCHVYIANPECIFDLFTLQALKDMTTEISKYIDKHGYSDVTEITIIESSVIKEKAYPSYNCVMTGVDNKILNVRYNLETLSFEIKFV